MKSLIVIGPSESGKTLLAKFLEGLFPKNVIYAISYNYFSMRSAGCHEKVKLIIIEGLNPNKVEDFFNIISDGVEIQDRKGDFKRISPRFMLMIHSEHPGVPALLARSKSASFSARFSIIQLAANVT